MPLSDEEIAVAVVQAMRKDAVLRDGLRMAIELKETEWLTSLVTQVLETTFGVVVRAWNGLRTLVSWILESV